MRLSHNIFMVIVRPFERAKDVWVKLDPNQGAK
jgi:hypothetical protein